MEDLIAMLEKATEPSQELDGRIYCAINGMTFRSTGRDGSIHFEPHGPHKTRTMVTPHPYTSSLDEALTLVPSMWAPAIDLYVMSYVPGKNVWRAFLRNYGDGDVLKKVHATAKNAALAVCIASMKSRAALTAAEHR